MKGIKGPEILMEGLLEFWLRLKTLKCIVIYMDLKSVKTFWKLCENIICQPSVNVKKELQFISIHLIMEV